MAHWGWYWKHKLQHVPKTLCSQLITIDSFRLFKNKQLTEMCMNEEAFTFAAHGIRAVLRENGYQVTFEDGAYFIPIEKNPCRYGGFRYYFHCPKCDKRMVKLYCHQGVFLCRKCLNLGYFTQRLCPFERWFVMQDKIEKKLSSMVGSMFKKPPWMKYKTFDALSDRHLMYDSLIDDYREAAWGRMIGNKKNI